MGEEGYIPNSFASDFSSMKNCQISRPWSRRPDWCAATMRSISAMSNQPERASVDEVASAFACSTNGPRNHADTGVTNPIVRTEEHTSELHSQMRFSYAVFYLKK